MSLIPATTQLASYTTQPEVAYQQSTTQVLDTRDEDNMQLAAAPLAPTPPRGIEQEQPEQQQFLHQGSGFEAVEKEEDVSSPSKQNEIAV